MRLFLAPWKIWLALTSMSAVLAGCQDPVRQPEAPPSDSSGTSTTAGGTSTGGAPDTTPPNTPAAPTVAAYSKQTPIRLTWTNPGDNAGGSGVASYNIQVGTSVGASNSFSGNVAALLYDFTGASGSTLYYARIQAVDAAGNTSQWSDSSIAFRLDAVAPTVHVNILKPYGAGGSSSSLLVMWGAGSDNLTTQGNLKYSVYTAPESAQLTTLTQIDANGTKRNSADLIGTTVFEIPGITNSERLQINVVIEDQAGNRTPMAPATLTTPPEKPLCPNGEILAAVSTGSQIIAGGNFGMIGHCTGAGVVLNAATGAMIESDSLHRTHFIQGIVQAVVGDGSGGWYVGGIFDRVGQTAIKNLVHINSVGQVSNWTPNPDGQVFTLKLVGNRLFVGGDFSNIAGSARRAIASFAHSAGAPGALESWAPALNNWVRAIEVATPAGGVETVYLGGGFDKAGNPASTPLTARKGLAAFNASTGNLTTWNPALASVGSGVYALKISAGVAFVGGYFQKTAGISIGAAAVDLSGNSGVGVWQSWSPNPNGFVRAIEVATDGIFLGGDFSTVGGASRTSFAQVNKTTGSTTAWNQSSNALDINSVWALLLQGNTLFVGGQFQSVGGRSQYHLASFDVSAGTANQALIPDPNNSVTALAFQSQGGTDQLYVGGMFSGIYGYAQPRLLAMDLQGNLKLLKSMPNDEVRALALSGNTLYLGGLFTSVGSSTRTRVAAIDLASDTVLPFTATTSGKVNALLFDGAKLWIAGEAGNIAAEYGWGKRVDASTGTDDWSVTGSGNTTFPTPVKSLYLGTAGVYVSGGSYSAGYVKLFSNGASVTQNGTFSVSVQSGAVSSVVQSGSDLFVGGDFLKIANTTRLYFGLVHASTGALSSSFSSGASGGYVRHLSLLNGTHLVAAGNFSGFLGTTENKLAIFPVSSGTPLTLGIHPYSSLSTVLDLGSSSLFLGGYLFAVDDEIRGLPIWNLNTGLQY